MRNTRRDTLHTKAQRADATTVEDVELFDYVIKQRAAMRQAARRHPGEASEPFQNMVRTYDLLLKYGRFFKPISRPRRYRKGKRKECYGNSLDLAVACEELSYCEGLTVLDGLPLPIEHGWCVTESGEVVDLTLKTPGVTYFGIIFDKLFAITHDLPALDSVLMENAKPAAWRPKPRGE